MTAKHDFLNRDRSSQQITLRKIFYLIFLFLTKKFSITNFLFLIKNIHPST
jgi:hypothetical protein